MKVAMFFGVFFFLKVKTAKVDIMLFPFPFIVIYLFRACYRFTK